MNTRTAAAILVGDEILSGKIADKNLVVLARVMRELGVELVRSVTIRDDLATIEREVRQAAGAHTWVFTSGGIGPTHDDMTILAVAKAFDKQLILSAELERRIRAVYAERVREGHLLMARIPDGARLVQSEDVPWPAILMNNVWILPGVPEVFSMKMTLVRSVIHASAAFVSLAVYTTLDEGNLKPLLDRVVERFPDVSVGSYPRWTDPVARTKITFDTQNAARCEEARSAFLASLPEDAVAPAPEDEKSEPSS